MNASREHSYPITFYLLQQAEPSEGCSQQAPLFSSFDWLGVQHTVASSLGVQQDEADSNFSFFVIFDFLITGILVVVSIALKFISYKDEVIAK